nr:hypothetical protein [Tanacetum cinerariifolium]
RREKALHNEDFSEKIFSNPLFEEEISSIKKKQHHFNDESDLVESMLNHDSSIISSSSKIDSLLDELLYDNSSSRPPEEFNSENSNPEIESFSPSPIPDEDSDSFMEEIDLFLTPDDPMPPSIEDDEDFEVDILFERLLHNDPIPLSDTLDFSYEVRIFLPFFTYPVASPVLLSSVKTPRQRRQNLIAGSHTFCYGRQKEPKSPERSSITGVAKSYPGSFPQ